MRLLIRLPLFFVASGVVSLVVALHASHAPAAAALVLATLWLGFVVAASFAMPLTMGFEWLDDDDGGAIPVTNAVEVALAGGLLAVYYPPGRRSHRHAGSRELTALLSVAGIQMVLFHCVNGGIQSAIKAVRTAQRSEVGIHARWRADEEMWWMRKQLVVQGVYMVVELAKVALLVAVVVALFRDLAAQSP